MLKKSNIDTTDKRCHGNYKDNHTANYKGWINFICISTINSILSKEANTQPKIQPGTYEYPLPRQNPRNAFEKLSNINEKFMAIMYKI